MAPIRGVALSRPSVQLGPFIIYSPKEILGKISLNESDIDLYRLKFLNELPLIEIEVSAKDEDRCYEKASLAFAKFESVCNYITGSFYNESKVRIFNQNMPNEAECIFIADGEVTKSIKQVHHYNDVSIDEPFYQDSNRGYDKIWWWITNAQNDLQQKILNSVEWCGRALVDPDTVKALLQFVIAIESLLQFNEGSFITPSIVSHLSDSVAFLLGNDRKSRIECAGYIKDLYAIRSKIAHTGIAVVPSLSLHTAHVMCKRVVTKITTEAPYNSFSNKKELGNYLSNLKFG
ncbi:MAG TPA: hypothetical protein VHE34_12680 [Puia sp.]|uniref:hypothetical protein n=1 Tax=Puia sp. TaxID=2045100 RepID=UPI002C2453F0|nr:hypothetical protein [Puia sp.]HVU96078.1 hypothetical protein [Puia sp.]